MDCLSFAGHFLAEEAFGNPNPLNCRIAEAALSFDYDRVVLLWGVGSCYLSLHISPKPPCFQCLLHLISNLQSVY